MKIFQKTWFWIILVAVVIAGGVLFWGMREDGANEENVAIRVNETEYSYEEFNQVVDSMSQQGQMFGMQMTEEDLFNETKDVLIREALLLEYVEDQDIEITDDDLDAEIEELLTMYGISTEEELIEQLQMGGEQIEDRGDLDEALEPQAKLNKLILIYEEDVEVTDEQLEEEYEDFVEREEQQAEVQGMDGEVPSFEEVENQLREELTSRKAQEKIMTTTEEMRQEAEIDVFVTIEDVELEEPEMEGGIDVDPEELEELEEMEEMEEMEQIEDIEE